jgi:hypothetical protein
MEVREDGLYFKRQNGEGLVPWSHILKWRHNKKIILVYPVANVFYMIPSHFFSTSEGYAALVKNIEARIGNAT